MKLGEGLQQYLRAQSWGAVQSAHPISGSSINRVFWLETEHGPPALLKTNRSSPPDMFAREAEGLQALLQAGGVRVPAVHAHGDDWLLIEYLPAATRSDDYWAALGEGLARLHSTVEGRFGFSNDNYIGSTAQPNAWTEDGHEFFAESRLRFQGWLARERGLLSAGDYRLLGRVIERLPNLIPEQPASLIHGGLWGGNVIVGPQGEPVLVDPAAHFGWAEAELAMTTLFGRFEREAYNAYERIRALAPGYMQRVDIYNLYHLLNHLNLFGHGYIGQVQGVLRRYC